MCVQCHAPAALPRGKEKRYTPFSTVGWAGLATGLEGYE